MEKTFLIVCGKLFDGIHDELFANQEILVEGKYIKQVGRNLSRRTDAEIIDLSDFTVTPGMIDAHIHTDVFDWRTYNKQWPSDAMANLYHLFCAQRTLERGFTTIRSLSHVSHDYGVVDVKRAIDSGYFIGSRMVVSTHPIGALGGHGDYTLNYATNPRVAESILYPHTGCGPSFFRHAVRQQIKYGGDFIKVYMSGGFFTPFDSPEDKHLEDDEVQAIIEVAHSFRSTVTAHVYAAECMRTLAKYDIDGMEHGALIDAETADIMEKKDIYLVPTFSAFESAVYAHEEDIANWPVHAQSKLMYYQPKMIEGRKIIKNSKIRLGFGSDIVVNHQCYESWREYEAWMKQGYDPFRILKAATSVNAGILQVDNIVGTVEPGKYADIAAWYRDLLQDSQALSQCDFVMKEGVVYPTKYEDQI